MPTISRILGELPPRPAIPSAWNGDEQDLICLHLGESPFPPTAGVREALQQASKLVQRYPDTSCLDVRQKLARVLGHGITTDRIVCGNGSDDLIDLICLAYAGPNAAVVSFDPTFFVYRACARRHGAHYISVPRDEANDFAFPDTSNLSRGLMAHRPQLIFLANPNNPTGTLTPRKRIEALLQSTQGGPLVVVDECYYDYSEATVIDLIETYPDLVVLRSLSKGCSLAGLRFGYAVGCAQVIESLQRASLTFPVNALAQVAAVAALDDGEEIRKRAKWLVAERERMAGLLSKLGLRVASSAANFLLVSSESASLPADTASLLADQGILVSDQSRTPGLNGTCLRIGVGSRQQTDRLAAALEEILKPAPDGA